MNLPLTESNKKKLIDYLSFIEDNLNKVESISIIRELLTKANEMDYFIISEELKSVIPSQIPDLNTIYKSIISNLSEHVTSLINNTNGDSSNKNNIEIWRDYIKIAEVYYTWSKIEPILHANRYGLFCKYMRMAKEIWLKIPERYKKNLQCEFEKMPNKKARVD